MINWLFVDDSKEDRDAFATALSEGGLVEVKPISAIDTRNQLAKAKLAPAGILMDIDLSNESFADASGLGLTADIRAAQHRGQLPPFPIVRFSYRDRVAANIGRDSSSDQNFDLKIDKDRLSDAGTVASVQHKLAGVSEVYAAVAEKNKEATAINILGVTGEMWEIWGSPTFDDQLRIADRDYAKARLFVQALAAPGLLISQELVATRLGIDSAKSSGFGGLLEALRPAKYNGVAASHFSRWWARGLEMWWDSLSAAAPLAATPISSRHDFLSEKFEGLMPLEMRADSLGDRPWRACELTWEESGEFLPIDPARAVRFRLRSNAPDWLDPTYAALGPAIKHEEDPRLDLADLARLKTYTRAR